MADAVEVAIEGALLAQLAAFSLSPAIDIAYPNQPFTPPPDKTKIGGTTVYGRYLRATFLPAPAFALGVGFAGTNQHGGILQVDVFHGQGAGELAPGRIAAAVIAHFKRGTQMARDGFTVLVNDTPRRAQMLKDDPWVMIPVSIPYIAFASNPA